MERAVDCVAIIPARGGSKGLPRKNLRPLAGRPLIEYSIEAARGCAAVAAVYVSTEDSDIAATARAAGANVIERPGELAGDFVTTNDVVAHALEVIRERGEHFGHCVLLQPTSPMRSAAHLAKALRHYSESRSRSLVSVCPAEHPPQKDFRIERDRLVPLFGEEFLERPRQQLEPVFRQNGAIYIVEVQAFMQRRRFYLPPCLPFVMDREDSIDVDCELDLDLAEAVLRRRGRG